MRKRRILAVFLVAALAGCDQSANDASTTDPNHADINIQTIYKVGENRLGTQYPKIDTPGFELARGSLAGLISIAEKIKNSSGNMETEILPTLYALESAWPDRYSVNGLKIEAALWDCRDAVTVSRLQLQMLAQRQASEFESLGKIAYLERANCVLALTHVPAQAS